MNKSDQISQELIAKTMSELARAERQPTQSRAWSSSQGYRFLVPWSNSVLLRILVRKFTLTLPLREFKGMYGNLKDKKSLSTALNSSNPPSISSNLHFEDRLKTQLDDAARSVISNTEEGYKRDTTKDYLKFISFSQGSLEEIRGLVSQCQQDGFLKSVAGSSLADLGIDLKVWSEWCKNPANSIKLKEFKGKYRSLEETKGEDLTYEIFMELINKTDYLLRRLVVSLEDKQRKDKASL